MAKKTRRSQSYWKKRFSQLEEASHNYGQQTYAEIESAFTAAQRSIQSEIQTWYARFAVNNNVTLAEARRMLSARELAELKWDVNQYIEAGRLHGTDPVWMKQLENASARFHISRLEALQLRTQQALEVAFGNELDAVDLMTRKVFTENYYHSIFEVQKGFNIGWEIGQIDDRELDKVVKKPWSTDGKNFSNRIWTKKSQMVNQLHQELTRTLVQGKAPDAAIEHMMKYVDKSVKNAKHAASTLVMTEEAYFHSVSQQEAFNDLDVEEYEIVATLDSHTSEICQEMDGKHFPMKDYEAGVTAPPFHPNCRSVTAPYFDDEWSVGERAARGEDGKTYYVPDSMKYPEWKKSMVEGNTEGLTEVSPDASQNTVPGATIKPQRDYQTDLSQKFGQSHYDGMHDLVDACQTDSAVEVWQKYEKNIKVGDAAYKGREHASGSTIYVNGQNDAKGSTWEKPFQVSFHESGHAIDSMNASKGTGVGRHFSSTYKNGIFPQTITREVNDMVDAKAVTIKQAFKDHKGDWDWLHQQGYISTTSYNWFKQYGRWLGGEPKYSKSLAYKAVEQEIKALAPFAKADLSDILEGATNARISVGFGHGASYWKQRMWMGVNDGLATEAFAEMMDSTFACPESLAAIQQYLPDSYDIFLEMLEFLANN